MVFKRFIALAFLLSVVLAQDAQAASWKFKHDRGVRVKSGVSTEAVKIDSGGIRLYVTAMGIELFQSSNGLTFNSVDASTPQGSDPAIVTLADGSMRMYYIATKGGPAPKAGPQFDKEVKSATSQDGLNWSVEEGTRLADAGYGVPDVVPLPTGGWRMYWVAKGPNRESIIKSAVSSDGLSFTEEKGYRLPANYVDPAVIRLANGRWLMAMATLSFNKPQRIHLAESSNGLKWRLQKKPFIINGKKGSALDPTLLQLGKRRYRVYYSTAKAFTFEGPFRVESGVMSPARRSR